MLKRTFSCTHPVINGFTFDFTVFLVILIWTQYGYCQKTISAGYGEYLYNRETGIMYPLISPHLFSDASPVMITSGDTVYIYVRVQVGKSYGHSEIYEISDGAVITVFQGSGKGS